MPHTEIPSTDLTSDEVAASLTKHQPLSGNTPSQAKAPTVEEQLAQVIGAARDVAVVAEELLREFVALEASAGSGVVRSVPHAVILAPRLLAATQQQLTSLLAMMKTI